MEGVVGCFGKNCTQVQEVAEVKELKDRSTGAIPPCFAVIGRGTVACVLKSWREKTNRAAGKIFGGWSAAARG